MKGKNDSTPFLPLKSKTGGEVTYMQNKDDMYLATLFSLKQNNFFLEHKLSPVHLTWLHLVYGKILFQPRHPHLMVSEENYTI